MAAKVLEEEHKQFIIRALARFQSPSKVIESVRNEFKITVSQQAVSFYDPTTAAGSKGLSEEHKKLFYETRAAYTQDLNSIGVYHLAHRLRLLEKMAESAFEKGNYKQTKDLLEQAAKDAGGAFTNRRELTGQGGAPLNPGPAPQDFSEFSDEELDLFERLEAKSLRLAAKRGGEEGAAHER